MKTRTMLLTTVFALSASMSFALTNDEIIAGLQSEGFTRIEIKTGPTQVKAEAIRGTEKHEIVYDAATGKVLKMEVETVEAGEDTNPGVEVDIEDHDFVGSDDATDDNSDDETDDSNDDSSDDSSDDDSNDDSGNDDSGSDDSGNDDSGSDDSGDDDSGDDDSGDDDSGSDDSGSDNSGKGGEGSDD